MKRAPKPPPLPPIGDHPERMHYQPLVGSEVRQWIIEQAIQRGVSASTVVAHLIEVGHGALQWWQDGGEQPEPVELEDESHLATARAALATSRLRAAGGCVMTITDEMQREPGTQYEPLYPCKNEYCNRFEHTFLADDAGVVAATAVLLRQLHRLWPR